MKLLVTTGRLGLAALRRTVFARATSRARLRSEDPEHPALTARLPATSSIVYEKFTSGDVDSESGSRHSVD